MNKYIFNFVSIRFNRRLLYVHIVCIVYVSFQIMAINLFLLTHVSSQGAFAVLLADKVCCMSTTHITITCSIHPHSSQHAQRYYLLVCNVTIHARVAFLRIILAVLYIYNKFNDACIFEYENFNRRFDWPILLALTESGLYSIKRSQRSSFGLKLSR